MSYGLSPFDARGGDPLGGASAWVSQVMLGQLAVGLCVVAVALIGLGMLGGRVNVRTGLRVVLGCFVLLGAPGIAASLLGFAEEVQVPVEVHVAAEESPLIREALPPSDYNPYARASMREDSQ